MRNSKRMWWIHVCRGTARAVGCGVGTSKIVSHDCSQDVEPIQLVGVGVGVGVGVECSRPRGGGVAAAGGFCWVAQAQRV